MPGGRASSPGAHPARTSTIVAIGASTGGVEAIEAILVGLPESHSGILIVQHIPATFSNAFANRLNQICAMHVKVAANGDAIGPGRVLIAPGGHHLLLRTTRIGYYAALSDEPPACYQRPSVDVLFSSVAEAAGANAIGVLLTGMGTDGAEGLLKMKRAGARTIVQDENSSVVFGMPKEAIQKGAVDRVLPLSKIAGALRLEARR